jgi:hypothetical protein
MMMNNFMDDIAIKNKELSMSEMIRQMCDSVQENSDGGKNTTDKKNSSSGKQSAGDSRD